MSASFSSSWPTGSTTCARSNTSNPSSSSAFPARRWTSTRPSRSAWAWAWFVASLRTWHSAISSPKRSSPCKKKSATRRPSTKNFSRKSKPPSRPNRSEEHTSELQSHVNLVCRLLLEKKKKNKKKQKDDNQKQKQEIN